MDLPLGYEFRGPTRNDLDAVAGVLVADELEDAGETTLGAHFVRREWDRGGFDLSADAWVALDSSGVIVGYGQVRREEPDLVDSWGVVHPEHRGRGIGSSLLDRMLDHASTLTEASSPARFRHAVNAGDQAAAGLLRDRGLRPVHHFWHMQIDLAGPFDPGESPEGIEIRGIEPGGDLPAVHAVLEAAFVDDRSHHPKAFDRWMEEETGDPSFDPTLWLLARDAGVPVGTLTASVGALDHGWVDYLGVLAPYRGRGIGAALLRRSFAMIADRGLPRALVSVDAQNPTGATALYEHVGMRIVKRWDLWERPFGSR